MLGAPRGSTGTSSGGECAACAVDADCGPDAYCFDGLGQGGTRACSAPCLDGDRCADPRSICINVTQPGAERPQATCVPEGLVCAPGSTTVSTTTTTNTSTTNASTGSTGGGECAPCGSDADCATGRACVFGTCAKPCDADLSCPTADELCIRYGGNEAACLSLNCVSGGFGTGSFGSGGFGTGGFGSGGFGTAGGTLATTGSFGSGGFGTASGNVSATGGSGGGGGECASCATAGDCAQGYQCFSFGAGQGLCVQGCSSQSDCTDPTAFCAPVGPGGQICVPQSLCGLGGAGGGPGGGFGGGPGGGGGGGGACNTDSDCGGRQTCCDGICSDTRCGLCGDTCVHYMCDPGSRCRMGTCSCTCPDGSTCPDPNIGTLSCSTVPNTCPSLP